MKILVEINDDYLVELSKELNIEDKEPAIGFKVEYIDVALKLEYKKKDQKAGKPTVRLEPDRPSPNWSFKVTS